MKWIVILGFLPLVLRAQSSAEQKHWADQAARVTIVRDNWGIPHVYAKTNADCVFGLLYAQCEDDFPRIEMNYVEKLGRMAEVKGENALNDDLLIRLVIDSADAIADYKKSPAWLKKLLDAFADGINYYLYRHPEEKPKLLTRFEPWFPLLWTDGSIGAINTAGVSAREIGSFYSGKPDFSLSTIYREEEPVGSNGFAIAPQKSATGHALLYINPHVSFYFRPEVQMVSEEGLDVYGAVTWGQFFVYQGFNEHCGWMHTSSAVDVADLYIEKISASGDQLYYTYDNQQKEVIHRSVTLRYRTPAGFASKTIDALFTEHGPLVTKRNGQWLSLRSFNRSMDALIQSWTRTLATGLKDFQQAMDLRTNTSNNTVYADDRGNIAYWHGNFIPRRDTAFDWARPVDGTTSKTEWQGLYPVNQTVHELNPATGWIQNCNSTPFTASGPASPDKTKYPSFMAPDAENFRGLNAVNLLSARNSFTLDQLIQAGYDTYLSAFGLLVPALIRSYDQMDLKTDTGYTDLSAAVDTLRHWDLHSAENSVATTLAVEWAQRLIGRIVGKRDWYEELDLVQKTKDFVAQAGPRDLLDPFRESLNHLVQTWGRWSVPWGEINRYQRLSGNIEEHFDDQQASLPVGRASATWGCLPSFGSQYFPNTKKRYGVFGNSFICAVEFGPRVHAKSLLTGGESGRPASPHFNDQALMYCQGQFKDVLFYREDVMKHASRTYHPGASGYQ